jgi:hypothetical protein
MNHEPKLVRSQSETADLLLGGNREAGFVLGLDEKDSRFKLAMTSEAALGFWIVLSKAGEQSLLMHGELFSVTKDLQTIKRVPCIPISTIHCYVSFHLF